MRLAKLALFIAGYVSPVGATTLSAFSFPGATGTYAEVSAMAALSLATVTALAYNTASSTIMAASARSIFRAPARPRCKPSTPSVPS